MNTQKGFLDNTVDDGFVVDGTEELNTEMCSYIQNDIEEMCSSMRDDTHRKYREISAEISGFWAFLRCGSVYLPPICYRNFEN